MARLLTLAIDVLISPDRCFLPSDAAKIISVESQSDSTPLQNGALGFVRGQRVLDSEFEHRRGKPESERHASWVHAHAPESCASDLAALCSMSVSLVLAK